MELRDGNAWEAADRLNDLKLHILVDVQGLSYRVPDLEVCLSAICNLSLLVCVCMKMLLRCLRLWIQRRKIYDGLPLHLCVDVRQQVYSGYFAA